MIRPPAWAVAAMLMLGGLWYCSLARVFYQNDFRAYWIAGHAAGSGLDPYTNNVAHGADFEDAGWREASSRFLYPPTSLLLFAPLGKLSYNAAKAVFTLLIFAALLASLLLLYRDLAVDAVWIVLLAASPPVLANFDRGQIDLLVLLLLVLAWYRVETPIAGLALAAAVLFKLFPLLLLLWLLAYRKTGTVLWTIVFLAAGTAATLLLWPARYFLECSQTLFHPDHSLLPMLANVPYGTAKFVSGGKVYLDKLWLFSSWNNPLGLMGRWGLPLAAVAVLAGLWWLRSRKVDEQLSYFAFMFVTLAANMRLWPMGFVLYFPVCLAMLAKAGKDWLAAIVLVVPLFLPNAYPLGISRLPLAMLALAFALWRLGFATRPASPPITETL